MKFKILTPSKALIESASPDEMEALAKALKYVNTSAQYLLRKHYNNRWFRQKNPEGWKFRLEELKKDVNRSLVFTDSDGRGFIRPGSIPYIRDDIKVETESLIHYPTPKAIPWAKPLPFELYPYQKEGVEKLVAARHANVELCTGAGKLSIILKLCRDTGFRCAVVVPSRSIFNEQLEKFDTHLGRGQVGRFGDGKKVLDKRITVCIGDSICNVKPGTREFEFFSRLDMLISDESHTFGSETLEKICHGVLAGIPYRFFLSGTQCRGDGGDKLLQSIIGETVGTLSTADAVRGGYVCPHDYRIVEVESSNPSYSSPEPLEEKRIHFLRNRNIANFIAKLANAEAKVFGRQTLVLVDETSQIAMLAPLLTVPYAIAHSETKKERLGELGISKVDTAESVDQFNRNEAKVLIGTSCIATGTNIYPCHNTMNWQGGSSEVKTRQGAVGRSVRFGHQNPYADRCQLKPRSIIWDFDVRGNETLSRHLDQRVEYYEQSGAEIKRIKLR